MSKVGQKYESQKKPRVGKLIFQEVGSCASSWHKGKGLWHLKSLLREREPPNPKEKMYP